MKTEEKIIEYETARNEAMDAWFDARPQFERTKENEFIFEGGFRMATDFYWRFLQAQKASARIDK